MKNIIFTLSLTFVEDRRHLNNKNKNSFYFVLSSVCTIFALNLQMNREIRK